MAELTNGLDEMTHKMEELRALNDKLNKSENDVLTRSKELEKNIKLLDAELVQLQEDRSAADLARNNTREA